MATSNDTHKSLTALAHEGLVRFCANLGNKMFVEQWVTPLVYNQLLEEAVNIKIHSAIDSQKDQLDALCNYCEKEFLNKMRLVEHHWRGCHVDHKVPSYKTKGEGLPLYPNLKTIALSVAIAKQIDSGKVLPINNRKGVDGN